VSVADVLKHTAKDPRKGNPRLSGGRGEGERPFVPSVAVHHFVWADGATGERELSLWTENVASSAEVRAEKLEIPGRAVKQIARVCNSAVWLLRRDSNPRPGG
jgi:hypothetical protein